MRIKRKETREENKFRLLETHNAMKAFKNGQQERPWTSPMTVVAGQSNCQFQHRRQRSLLDRNNCKGGQKLKNCKHKIDVRVFRGKTQQSNKITHTATRKMIILRTAFLIRTQACPGLRQEVVIWQDFLECRQIE
jgi:hypothetical protein